MGALGWLLNLGFAGSAGAGAAFQPALAQYANEVLGSMKKNVASQVVGAQMINASDGTAFTGSATVVVTIDGGTQSASGGTGPTHEGNGYHTYLPTQAETNGDIVGFTFTGTGAVPVTVQVYTDFPQTGDGFARLGAPIGASISADIATVDGNVDAILADTGTDGVVLAAGSVTAAVVATGAIDADALAADAGTEIGTAVWASATRTLTANTNLNDPTAAAIADAVWDEPKADHTTSTTFGDLATDLDAVLADTADMQPKLGTPAGASISADIATVDANVDSILADTGTDGVALSAAAVSSILTTQMTESYAADGVAPTIAQALMLIQQTLGEFAVSGTTLTVKQLNGTTTAATFTLNDGTSPTSITRAT